MSTSRTSVPTFLDALRGGLHQCFAEDPRVHILGEDLLDPYGGAFKVTRGLSTAYPDRVHPTPISEGGFTGVAVGMALRGLRPIVEIMFGDFMTLCCDQIVNHATKFRAMYADKVAVPLVVRSPVGAGRGYGATHSQSLEKIFLGTPNLTVVSPSLFHDVSRLIHHAVRNDDGVTLFFEHKLLYPQKLLTSGTGLVVETVDEPNGYPTCVVRNYDEGAPDMTLITHGGVSRLLPDLLAEAAREEIRVAVVLPSALQPMPTATLADWSGRSGRVVLAEEATAGFGWSAQVANELYTRLFGRLRAPIRTVAYAPTIMPSAPAMEREVMFDGAALLTAMVEVLSLWTWSRSSGRIRTTQPAASCAATRRRANA
jgi:acetoin:2,6-dichlorophenolindophenol oxidoreductase subunit beta